MKILVSGSTGFIGSHLCRKLLELGHEVRAFHRPDSPLLLIDGLSVESAIGDITQPNTLKSALQDIEIVFHAAAKLGKSTPDETYRVTVAGTRNVLEACRAAAVKRVIHISSVAALGLPAINGKSPEITPNYLINENHSWNYLPRWWSYGYAKHLAEMEVQYATTRGLDSVIVNPTLVIGAGDINRVAGDVILRVARGQFKVTSAGGLNAIHIKDVVNGCISVMESGSTGHRYILGHENLTHTDFLKLIARKTGANPPRLILPGRFLRGFAGVISAIEEIIPLPFAGDALRKIGYYFYYDTEKIKSELGLMNMYTVEDGITEALEWYRSQGVI